MSHHGPVRGRSPSLGASGRSTPTPRASQRAAEDESVKADKVLRRYGVAIERTIASWETSPSEWADYIAFLSRLLKTLQGHPNDAHILPHSGAIASKLAQCLNPALPPGVHLKALEVYAYIFSTLGYGYLAGHLHEFLPGLAAVLSFASLSARPAVYAIYENHILRLSADDLRPTIKALVLSVLPALEEETSEDFDRAFRILERLEHLSCPPATNEQVPADGFFWQCLFLSVVTSPSKRQGALNYLLRRLPKFAKPSQHRDLSDRNGQTADILASAETILSPEPGLLVRCFVSGLLDDQLLIQRGFLDLLVTHLPLHSPALSRVREDDIDRLVTAAINLLLRREMSLNRRLWNWFLGTDSSSEKDSTQVASSDDQRRSSNDIAADQGYTYFTTYGQRTLERCILAMFRHGALDASTSARPFRICLSLMDRWEIGGAVIPRVFLPAMEYAYKYSIEATSANTTDLVRSASLFFDGVEPMLIWANLLRLLRPGDSALRSTVNGLQMFSWIIRHFNITDEEMRATHIPLAAIYIISLLQDKKVSSDNVAEAYHILTTLVGLVPEKTLAISHSRSSWDDVKAEAVQAQSSIEAFYQAQERLPSNDLLPDPQGRGRMLIQGTQVLVLGSLVNDYGGCFDRAVGLLLALNSKAINCTVTWAGDFIASMSSNIANVLDNGHMLSFADITCLVVLVCDLAKTGGSKPRDLIWLELASTLQAQLWDCLAPNQPKHHVEAVKAIWQLHDASGNSALTRDSLAALVRVAQAPSKTNSSRVTAIKRFAVLWTHTNTGSAGTGSERTSLIRRSSSVPSARDLHTSATRREILTPPLMLILDTLQDSRSEIRDATTDWISNVPSLDQILAIHLDEIGELCARATDLPGREAEQDLREVEYLLGHVYQMLCYGREHVRQCLSEMTCTGHNTTTEPSPGLVVLAGYCKRFIDLEVYRTTLIERKAVEILSLILPHESAASLKILHVESSLLERLISMLKSNEDTMQRLLLEVTAQALGMQMDKSVGNDEVDRPRSRNSTSSKRPSDGTMQHNLNALATTVVSGPPPQLLDCLKLGFSSECARTHSQQWLLFMSNVLPLFAESIFANLIPMVDCFCQELNKSHDDLVALSSSLPGRARSSPESVVLTLLEALEMVLARAHDILMTDTPPEAEPKLAVQSRGLLSNVTSGVFRAESPVSRNAQSNSRLTVLLALHDAVRVSMKLWLWASRYSEIVDFDKTSAATTAYNALKVRNRTRHFLEQACAAEPLETLEVIAYHWCHSLTADASSSAIDLLHVLNGLRPKIIVTATLDALCSRMNSSILPTSRQSSLAIDLTPIDLAVFMKAYLQSLEDDATDEVWPDCTAFLRDVCANPLPYRLVLPSLLSITLLLAQKVNNTNFGEQRKMRKELADLFLRLLTATVNTSSTGYAQDGGVSHDLPDLEQTNCVAGRQSMSLMNVLKDVTANIDLIVDSNDKATSAVNTITTSFIAPLLHAKTFPANVDTATLGVLLQIARKGVALKPWKKELTDAFNDPKILSSSVAVMETAWFPVFNQWVMHDRERMPELVARLVAPSSAGIMFGVGASAARLEADRKAQLNIRRICLLLLASPQDTFVSQLRDIWEKLVELFGSDLASSPSAAVKSELFMLCSALILSMSHIHLAPLWPVINDNMQAALTSLSPGVPDTSTFGNLALLQCCKLLDLLVALAPEEFQLHEWLYITDTVDAVYQPAHWTPSALTDQVAEGLSADGTVDADPVLAPEPTINSGSGGRRPLIVNDPSADKSDYKAMTRADFARTVLRPFLSQLSIHAYEGVYSMDSADQAVWRRTLLEDILDLTTIVE